MRGDIKYSSRNAIEMCTASTHVASNCSNHVLLQVDQINLFVLNWHTVYLLKRYCSKFNADFIGTNLNDREMHKLFATIFIMSIYGKFLMHHRFHIICVKCYWARKQIRYTNCIRIGMDGIEPR